MRLLRCAFVLWLVASVACSGGSAGTTPDASSGGGADGGAPPGHDASADGQAVPGPDAQADGGPHDATVDAPVDAPMDSANEAGDGAVACVQTFTGDETATLPCSASLCLPTGAGFEVLDVSSGGHILRPAVTGSFAPGTYTDAMLSTQSTFAITTASATYSAGVGAGVLPGQQIKLVLDSVQSPSANPCDGVAHGTLDATLVQVEPDGGVGAGTIVAHVVF